MWYVVTVAAVIFFSLAALAVGACMAAGRASAAERGDLPPEAEDSPARSAGVVVRHKAASG